MTEEIKEDELIVKLRQLAAECKEKGVNTVAVALYAIVFSCLANVDKELASLCKKFCGEWTDRIESEQN